ncbi:hypothetical protein SO802_004452 [Lithocarpus litseifolius]|uniref:Reverse transcriptase RNase H-like domain-containing protein n=1 Tax=Lithocarpus litseifolius TaxID=425828 RepID=A0AAW2E6K7_9ROSI
MSILLVKQIKSHVKTLPRLGIPTVNAFKIVETDASDIGYGGILKQRVSPDSSEQIIRFYSGIWNTAQLNYSTIKKEILSIVLCISKFQSDLLNQKFLLRIDSKSAKYVIEKDVENIASKHIFSKWQAILSVFDFDIDYIKGSQNAIPDILTREFLQNTNGNMRNSILIKTICDKKDSSKWGPSPNDTRLTPKSPIPYSYHDYITAWFKFMLHQNDNMTHSWFVNFDKHFTGYLPLWFIRWWSQFGLVPEILLDPLMEVFRLFSSSYRVNPYGAKFPLLLHFVKQNKIPWILKWQYEKHEDDVLARNWYVKWWDKFPHIQQIVSTVTRECSVYAAPPMARDYIPIQAPV